MTGNSGEAIAILFVIFFGVLAVSFLISSVQQKKRDKTMIHRKRVMDLLVVGKLRQVAEEEKVDLEKELGFLKRMEDLDKIKSNDLDNEIEEEITKRAKVKKDK